MAIHSDLRVNGLVQQLQERHEKLVEIVQGRAPTEDERMRHSVPNDHRVVNPSRVRVAVDDYMTMLREVKKLLGK